MELIHEFSNSTPAKVNNNTASLHFIKPEAFLDVSMNSVQTRYIQKRFTIMIDVPTQIYSAMDGSLAGSTTNGSNFSVSPSSLGMMTP